MACRNVHVCVFIVFATGLLSSCGNALRTPIACIHWAGTETAADWCGYMEGALQSGARAANEVLQLLTAPAGAL